MTALDTLSTHRFLLTPPHPVDVDEVVAELKRRFGPRLAVGHRRHGAWLAIHDRIHLDVGARRVVCEVHPNSSDRTHELDVMSVRTTLDDIAGVHRRRLRAA
jgi:hypothetical protein